MILVLKLYIITLQVIHEYKKDPYFWNVPFANSFAQKFSLYIDITLVHEGKRPFDLKKKVFWANLKSQTAHLKRSLPSWTNANGKFKSVFEQF